MEQICVIGGSGFIGTRLCKRLNKANKDFFIIDKKISQTFPENTHITDVRDIDRLKEAIKGATIVNLAAEHRDDVRPKSLYWEVNVDGAKNVCRVAEEKGINKIIFTSSVAVYGFTDKETYEDGDLKPFNDYGITKLEAEKVYIEWQKKDPLNRTLVIIRPTVVFGEGNRGNVYNLLNQIANGRFIMVGNGKNIKSMAYVENVAAFIEYAMTFPPGIHIYNYIDKPDFDMNTLITTIYTELIYSNKPYKPKSSPRRCSLSRLSTPDSRISNIDSRTSFLAFLALNLSRLIHPNKRDKRNQPFFHLPYALGLFAGKVFDIASLITGKKLPISSIRIKKFCSNTCFGTSIHKTGFVPPVSLHEGLSRTIRYEFFESHPNDPVFYTE